LICLGRDALRVEHRRRHNQPRTFPYPLCRCLNHEGSTSRLSEHHISFPLEFNHVLLGDEQVEIHVSCKSVDGALAVDSEKLDYIFGDASLDVDGEPSSFIDHLNLFYPFIDDDANSFDVGIGLDVDLAERLAIIRGLAAIELVAVSSMPTLVIFESSGCWYRSGSSVHDSLLGFVVACEIVKNGGSDDQ